MVYKLKNEFLDVQINSLGAELVGCKNKDGYEYIYQPTPLWPGQSKNLFPNIGTIADEYIIVKGEKYPANQHGFIKDMQFNACQMAENHIQFVLESSEATMKYLPYDFKCYIEYKLIGETLFQTFKVENLMDEEMYFGIGTHTGYIAQEGSYIDFENNGLLLLIERINMQYLTGKYQSYTVENGILPLETDTYNHGADILAGFNKNAVVLKNKNHPYYSRVDFTGFQYLGLWAPVKSQIAVSIMPWCGLPEMGGTNHVFEEKVGNVRLGGGKTFDVTLAMTFGKSE